VAPKLEQFTDLLPISFPLFWGFYAESGPVGGDQLPAALATPLSAGREVVGNMAPKLKPFPDLMPISCPVLGLVFMQNLAPWVGSNQQPAALVTPLSAGEVGGVTWPQNWNSFQIYCHFHAPFEWFPVESGPIGGEQPFTSSSSNPCPFLGSRWPV